MTKEKTQPLMMWLLPIVIIGGIFYPVLGYLVLLMMIFFLALAYFKGRFWCSHLCPRGAFLDLILNKVSLNKKIPAFFFKPAVKWMIVLLFMGFFVWQIVVADKTLYAVGFVFVRMCLITTGIAVFIGIPVKARMWCSVCPMGTIQGTISAAGRKKGK